MPEMWKPVQSYTNYEVSSQGSVRNVKTGRVLKPWLDKKYNYQVVELYRSKTDYEKFYIHNLVAQAFSQYTYDKWIVQHKDGDTTNNQWSNLTVRPGKGYTTKTDKSDALTHMFYFENEDGSWRMFDYTTKQYSVGDVKVSQFGDTRYHAMETKQGFEATDEGLSKFASDFMQKCAELRTVGIKFETYINPVKYMLKKHGNATLTANMAPITATEYKWFEKCYNSGIFHTDPNYVSKSDNLNYYQVYGYDYSRYYMRLMSSNDLLLPSKAGEETTLTKLPKKAKHLAFGIYRVKIVCEDIQVKKVFSFSHAHHYTSSSLAFAMHLRKTSFPSMTIDLVQDSKPNALLYDNECLIPSTQIFGKWVSVMSSLKEKFPKNYLVKQLSSRAWGYLCQDNTCCRRMEEIEAQNLNVDVVEPCDYLIMDERQNTKSELYYILLNTAEPYKTNIRIKPFLPALGRNVIAEAVMRDLKHTVRVACDGVMFVKHDPDICIQHFDRDSKTTGSVAFIDSRKYVRQT